MADKKKLQSRSYPISKWAGEFLYLSGISGLDLDESQALPSDIPQQPEKPFRNMESILKKEGLGLEHVIDVTTYLVDMKDFKGYNEVYGKFFDHTGPSRTTIAAKSLILKEMLIEVKAIAHRPKLTDKTQKETT